MLSMDKFILEECELEALETIELMDTLKYAEELAKGHEKGREEEIIV